MTQFYKQKLICIARCKNEIHIIKKWYKSLSFVDVFVMTDNNSTDGTYEYLKSLPNVIVIRVEEFDEGRDFQILLKVAKSLKPEWLLKIDCDEIFEENATKNMHKLLEQQKYNAFLFRKYAFDFRIGEKKYIKNPTHNIKYGLYLVKNSKYINIRNVKMHVGSFLFYSKPALSNFRVKHYHAQSKKKVIEKYKTYNKEKEKNDSRNYNYNLILSQEFLKTKNIYDFIKNEKKKDAYFQNFGYNCLYIKDKHLKIIKPIKNKLFFTLQIKLFFIKIINNFKLNKLFIFFLKKYR